MLRIHPAISSFPLAFIILVCALELWCLRRVNEKVSWAAWFLLLVSFASTLLTFISGYHASANTGELAESVEGILSNHHAWGRLALISIVVTVCLKWVSKVATQSRGVFKAIYFMMLIVTFFSLVISSHKGGGLVFDHGVGVQTRSL